MDAYCGRLANSCPVGFPGILFIGAYDNGSVERLRDPVNIDSLQKTLTKRIDDVWPPVYFLPKVLRRDGQELLAVLIPGSPLRPHFAAPSYVRVGSETRKASEDQFNVLLLERNSKAREIQQMVGKQISWELIGAKRGGTAGARVIACNQFFLTVDGGTYKRCFPLEWVTISSDPDNGQPHLIVTHP